MQSLFHRSTARRGLWLSSRHIVVPKASSSVRFLSQEIRAKLDAAVKAKPLVLFMKGTPDVPQCGFSRAVVQILDLHGVPHEKMQSYDVLVDPELRSSIKEYS